MKLLDKYILKKFFKTFFFVVITLNLIVCIVDYTEKADDFIQHDLDLGFIISEYYVNLFVHWMSTLSPLSVFIAVVFMTARLAQHTEIVAILSNGISYPRFLLPYVVGSSILASIIFGLVGWVIPQASKKKVAFEIQYVKSPYYFNERDIHMRINDSTFLYMESYNNKIQRGYRCTIEKIQGNQLTEKLSTSRIEWDSAIDMWHIEKYNIYQFNEDGTQKYTKGKGKDIDLGIHPKYFESKYNLQETLTITELNDYVNTEKARGVPNLGLYEEAIQERYSYPFAIILLTILGVIVSSRKTRGGTGVLIAVGFILAFIFLLMVIMSRAIAQAGALSPILVAWMPLIVFSVITAVLYKTLPK